MSDSQPPSARRDSYKTVVGFTGLSIWLCLVTGIMSLVASVVWDPDALIAAALSFGLMANALMRD